MLKRSLLNPNRSYGPDNLFGEPVETFANQSMALIMNESVDVPKRSAVFPPYVGYSIDEYKVANNDVRDIETKSIIRNLTYKDRLADKLYHRHVWGRMRRVYSAWKRHSFRYVFLRSQLLKCHLMRFLSRRFQGWRLVAMRESRLRTCVKNYWKRHRYLRFIRWKLDTKWMVMKERMLKMGFKHMLIHLAYQRRLNMRWQRIKSMYQRIVSALILQRAQRRHMKRKRYWANRAIKRFFMCLYGIRLVEERKRTERQRITLEIETSDVLVERGLTYLKNLLQEDAGRELHSLYLKAIKVILRKTNDTIGDVSVCSVLPSVSMCVRLCCCGAVLVLPSDAFFLMHFSSTFAATTQIQPMFPHRKEMPGIGAMWTTNGKAMYILKHRCEVEIRKLARDKFRLVSPPLYECRHCHCVCFLRPEIRNHRLCCQYNEDVDDQPAYVAWRLAQPVVEGALAPLKKHYAKQMKQLRAVRTQSNLQYMSQLKSFHWEKTPAKPLKYARSKSYIGNKSIRLSSSKSMLSRGGSTRSILTENNTAANGGGGVGGLSRNGSAAFMNNSFYGSVQSVDDEDTLDGTGTAVGTFAGSSKFGKSYPKGMFSTPSTYRLKSQKLLGNAIFSDGSVNKVQERVYDDLQDENVAHPHDEGDGSGDHDQQVDDWY